MRKRMESPTNPYVFPLTSLQIGDLQSYLSSLSLYLAPESKKFFILVDNRPWLMNRHSRPTHLWQFMVTKSRLSPFANTRARREKKENGRKFDLKSGSKPNHSRQKKLLRWFSVVDAAIARKKALLPVKDLHQTLYGFIVFEVSWGDVRGINYLNELQTDTSVALEVKHMRKWEFDSIEQASVRVFTWFSGTFHEACFLKDYLNEMSDKIMPFRSRICSSYGDSHFDGPFSEAFNQYVFYDAEECSSNLGNLDDDGRHVCTEETLLGDLDSGGMAGTQSPTHLELGLNLEYTPSSSPYKRRKITRSGTAGTDIDIALTEYRYYEQGSPRENLGSSSDGSSFGNLKSDSTLEPTHYRDILLLYKFSDRDLPFELSRIIMSDVRLLTLLETGLPSWVIFCQSYPVFCQLYRPWMRPLARTFYVMISVITVVIGFYDLYKNVPLVKATAAHLFGPFFDWIETWEMISRIKYLGTMLFLQNFEKAVKWFMVSTHALRSLIAVVTKPMSEPLMVIFEYLLPIWKLCIQTVENFGSAIWIVLESTFNIVGDLLEILLWPIWFIISVISSIATSIIYPLFLGLWEFLIAPIRLTLTLASYVALLFSNIFYVLRDAWFSISGISQLTAAVEAAPGTYEISMWRSLWNDLFSQVFRAVRSIVNGLVAFLTTCNRHRLSTYNHMQEVVLQLSRLLQRYRREDPHHASRKTQACNLMVYIELLYFILILHGSSELR
ncbi:hypothetical protein AMTRI_Chr10g228340 [Amborella trichopoda]